MKLCVECKWHSQAGILCFHLCARTKNQIGVNPVNGLETITWPSTCDEERSKLFFGCGKSGKYWEPKE